MEACDAVIQKGVPNDQVPGVFPATFKSTLNCTFEVDHDGKKQIAYVAYPEDQNVTIAFIKELPVYDLDGFVESPQEGVYTWLYYKKDGEFRWAFRPVRSILELATIHKAIARAVEADTIHAAGEVEKQKDGYLVNFLSGSFMEKDCDRAAKEKVMLKLFGEAFGRRNLKFALTDKTLITAKPTIDELRLYTSKGFRVCLHDPDKVSECKAMKGNCPNILKGGMENQQPPKKEENKTPKTPTRSFGITQAQEARRQLALRNSGVPEPAPQIEGMGRKKRKTRRGKKSKRRMTKKKW